MDKIITFFGTVALTIFGLFAFIIFSTFMGGAVGLVVGLVFRDPILGIASQLGIHNVTMFEFGCFLGFVGGFLKTKISVKVDSD